MSQTFFSRLLRPARTSSSDTQLPTTLPGSSVPAGMGHDAARELVRMAMRHVRAKAGIPKDWVSSDVLVLDRGYRQRLEVQIIVRHWDERWLRHSLALERALQLEIARLDPSVASSIRRVAWRFSSEAERPDVPWDTHTEPQPQAPMNPGKVEPALDLLDRMAARGELPAYAPHPSARAFAPTLPMAESVVDPAFAPTQPARRVLTAAGA